MATKIAARLQDMANFAAHGRAATRDAAERTPRRRQIPAKHGIDLRSDTVTTPSPEMRRAMFQAEVGDDSYGEDPTVRALEEKASECLGKSAAMLVLSTTMGNLVSVMAQTRPGQSVILPEGCHIHLGEGGGLARLAGLTARTVNAPRGLITPEAMNGAILSTSPTNPLTNLVCIENTFTAAGGTIIPVDAIDSLCMAAHERGLKVHMDGARLFNAAVALGVPAARIVEKVDTVTVCLTKSLGCPVGAIVVGRAEVVAEARRCRQAIGGGMRQAGVFAAAGIVAFDHMIDRLAEDHENARLLAKILAEANLPISIDPVETNMVYIELPGSDSLARNFVEEARAAGVILYQPQGRRVRMVTHYGIERTTIEKAAERIIACIRGLMPPRVQRQGASAEALQL
jgi:threonine aldolase